MLALLIVAGAFILCYVCQKCLGFDSRRRLPPLAFSLPLQGSPHLWTNDPHKALRKLWHRHGPIFRIHIGNDVIVLLNGARAIKEAVRLYPKILASAKALPTYTTSQLVDGAHRGDSVLWARRRAILISSYQHLGRDSLDLLVRILAEECEGMVGNLETVCDAGRGESVSKCFPVKYLANLIAACMFRIAYGGGSPVDPDTRHSLEDIADHIRDYARHYGPFNLLDRFPLLRWIPPMFSCDVTAYNYVPTCLRQFCSLQGER